MKGKYFKTTKVASISFLLILAAALLAASASYAANSPFIGEWFAIDNFDGSDIRTTITPGPRGTFMITWTESYFSGCGGQAGIVQGKGSLVADDMLAANLTLRCFTTGAKIDFSITWVYDPGTDTLSADYTTWQRANAGSTKCIAPPAGVSGWWPGDSDANDLVFGNNGSRQGSAVAGSGLVDQAFILHGGGDYIEVPGTPELNFGPGDFTIDLWVNFESLEGEQVLVEKWIQKDPNSQGWTLTKLDTQVIRLAFGNGNGLGDALDSNVLDLRRDTWYLFSATRKGQLITLYMNSTEIASREFAILNLNSSSSLKFGHRGNPTDTPGSDDERGFYLNGRIDEVELYNGTALTQDQILGIYNAGGAGKCKDNLFTPPMMNLRVNYGHDWVESFYEAGHSVRVMVTSSDGETIKATATVITEPKDFWNGETGFQTRMEDWVPGPPDILAYDWVFAWVDNGVSARVQIGEIDGGIDVATNSIEGTIYAPWISSAVPVECHPWGAPRPPNEIMKYPVPLVPDGVATYSCTWDPDTEWDIQPGQVLGVGYSDPDGNWVANAFLPPWIRAHTSWDSVDTWFFPQNKTLHLTVDDPKTEANPDVSMDLSGRVDERGSAWFELSPYDLKPGDIVTVTDGRIINSTIVTNLSIDWVEVGENKVYGSADPGAFVRLPMPTELYLTVGNDGLWTANFSDVGGTIEFNSPMIAEQYDGNGNLTSFDYSITPAQIHASEAGDWFWMNGFSPNATLYIAISESRTEFPFWSGEKTTDEGGFAIVGIGDTGIDLLPGYYITASDQTNTKGVVLEQTTVTVFDTEHDLMEGYAPPGRAVRAAAGPLAWQARLWVKSDPITGLWVADFTSIGFDILEQYRGSSFSEIFDADGDTNEGSTPPPPPPPPMSMRVWMDWNTVDGQGWGAEENITLRIGGLELNQTSASDGTVHFDVGIAGHDIVVGDMVEMTNGTQSKELVVPSLAITDYDLGGNIIKGTYDPGLGFYVYVYGQELTNITFSGNSWEATFNDLIPLQWGDAVQTISSGDSIAATIRTPNPTFYAVPDEDLISASEWSPGQLLTVKINGEDVASQVVPNTGGPYGPGVMFNLSGIYDILADDEITLTDGRSSKDLTVAVLAVTGYDFASKTLSGVATPGDLCISFRDVCTWIVVGGSGNWEFNVDPYGPGEWGNLIIYDSDGDQTRDIFMIPNP